MTAIKRHRRFLGNSPVRNYQTSMYSSLNDRLNDRLQGAEGAAGATGATGATGAADPRNSTVAVP